MLGLSKAQMVLFILANDLSVSADLSAVILIVHMSAISPAIYAMPCITLKRWIIPDDTKASASARIAPRPPTFDRGMHLDQCPVIQILAVGMLLSTGNSRKAVTHCFKLYRCLPLKLQQIPPS